MRIESHLAEAENHHVALNPWIKRVTPQALGWQYTVFWVVDYMYVCVPIIESFAAAWNGNYIFILNLLVVVLGSMDKPLSI